MDTGSAALKKQICLRLIAALFIVGLMLFLPAGSLYYWEGWIYLCILFVPMVLVLVYLLKHDPDLLVRRMRFREKEQEQKTIIKTAIPVFFGGFLIPGFDYRFGWSDVPVVLVLASDVIVFLGYFVIFLTFLENSYASRIIEVEKGQTVISTGPYAIVRHPMYLGWLLMFLFTPIALGSYWALIVFLPLAVMIIFRIRNEEEVLLRDLPGYKEYCTKVRYRLVPLVW